MNPAFSRVSIAVLLGSLAACRVGPDFHSPPLPRDAQAPLVSLDTTRESAQATPDAWWQLYQDTRLEGLIAEALRANNDLVAARANLTAAAAVIRGARAGRLPDTRVELAGVYGRDVTTDSILELTGRPPQTVWLLEDLFSMSYEVDLFGEISRSIETARASADAAAAALDSAKITVVAETARSYSLVCALGDQIAVARHSLEITQREFDITERRRGAGSASEFDAVRAQGQVAVARSKIPPLVGQRRAALFELTAVLGRTPADAPRDVEECVTAPRLTALLPVGDGVALLQRRPDVRRAESQVAAATASIGVATAQLYPKIGLTASYGGAATTSSELTKNTGLTWSIGPLITWNFPNQFAARAKIAQAKASTVAAVAQFDGTVLRALKETEQALSAYGAALEQYDALLDAEHIAQRAFDIAHGQFSSGAVSTLDLLITEDTLTNADAAIAQSRSLLIQDQIAVFKALGGGWRSVPPDQEAAR